MKHDDPRARRRGETDLQWKLRVARQEIEKLKGAPPMLPTAETQRHGIYRAGFVRHTETNTLAKAMRNQVGQSSLVRMHNAGHLTNDQFVASQRIARIAERIEGDVSVRGASLEARVDNACRKVSVIEHLSAVRDEIAYTQWRAGLRVPRRMVIDMLLLPQPLALTAAIHRMGWRRARRRLISALDSFIAIRERVNREVESVDLDRAHAKIAA